jgi:hypothetical protein
MAGLSDYGTARVLPLTVAGTRYMALLLEPSVESDTGLTLVEPTFVGYQRTPIADADWTTVSNGTISNAEPVALPVPPAGVGAGQTQIIQVALLDAATGGNIWWVLDAFAFVLDAADPSPELAVGSLLVGFPYMGGS